MTRATAASESAAIAMMAVVEHCHHRGCGLRGRLLLPVSVRLRSGRLPLLTLFARPGRFALMPSAGISMACSAHRWYCACVPGFLSVACDCCFAIWRSSFAIILLQKGGSASLERA